MSLKAHIADNMNRMQPVSGHTSVALPAGSMADPGDFERTNETFVAASTTFRFDDGATVKNIKNRGVILTDNLTAHVIRCPKQSGKIRVNWEQDSTGSRTIPAPTAVKSDGTTAVEIQFIGDTFMTETTTASAVDFMDFDYDAENAILREYRRELAYVPD